MVVLYEPNVSYLILRKEKNSNNENPKDKLPHWLAQSNKGSSTSSETHLLGIFYLEDALHSVESLAHCAVPEETEPHSKDR